ncbi:hypothetical protein [Dawidia soli]|uniref:Uncharacterized protein n=1 Tax=Dawidia soli TaxID=2782352 RepID=A0AAP2D6M5_9BACT|nr:hypothetical protein [Dawidia soli]MBT1684990.1 hypothetical protein [Dawidia soli]
MMLHCASRVGFLSYLYQQRQEIAFALGLIAEVPIAMCSSDYDFTDDLAVHVSDNDEAARHTLPMAFEINLFCTAVAMPDFAAKEAGNTPGISHDWCSPLAGCLRAIFHPPARIA